MPLSQAPAESRPRAPKLKYKYPITLQFDQNSNIVQRRQAAKATRFGRRAGRAINARKTGRAPVLMAGAWVRAPSIGRTGASRALCEVARSAAADSPCLGSGSSAKTRARPCIRRLSMVAGTARARWLRQLAAACWAETLPATATEADRALGPMLPASARERWPFCVVRDPCHAALPDQPGLPSIGSRRRTGGSRRRPRVLRLAVDQHCMHSAGAWPCCVGVILSTRTSVAQTSLTHARPEMEPLRAVRVQLCAFRRRSGRAGRPRSCRQVWLTWERQLMRACAKRVYVSLE
eukprot:COSAG02_NODE_4582_length_5188_cov_2.108166_4_plen_292_part_00